MKYWLLLFAFPFFLSAELVWQSQIKKPFAITIKLNSQQVPLDGFLIIEADFQYPSSYELNVENILNQLTWIANPLAPQIKLETSSISSLPTEKGIEFQRLHVTLSPLVSKSFDISFFSINFMSKEGNQPVNILTPVFNVQVLPISSQNNSLATAPLIPLEPEFPLGLTEANRQFLIENPKRWENEKRNIQRILAQHTFPWLTLTVLLGCAAISWAAYLTRERWLTRHLKPIPTPSPNQQAVQAIQTLQEKHLLEKGFIQDYYAELSSILLQIFQTRFGWKTKEMTTFEINQILKEEPALSLNQKKDILLFLTEMDQVKFAGKKPSLESTKEFFQQVKNLIQQLTSF